MEDDNFGDVLIYQTVKEKLEVAGLEVRYHEVGDESANIIQEANKNDFLLFAGGGIIERYAPDFLRNFRRNLKELKIPYGVIGVSIGDFDYRDYLEEFQCWVENAIFFYVRDNYTENYLNKLVKKKKVKYSGDVVFGNNFLRRQMKANGLQTGINIRNVPYPDLTGEYNWEKMKSVVAKIGCQIVIPDSHDDILKLGIRFENQNILSEYSELDRNKKTITVIKQIRRCGFIISMRYHVILVAALLGVIPIPIIYCPKVERLAKQLGIDRIASNLFDYESILKCYDLAVNNKEQICETIFEKISFIKMDVDLMFEKVIKEILYKLSDNK